MGAAYSTHGYDDKCLKHTETKSEVDRSVRTRIYRWQDGI